MPGKKSLVKTSFFNILYQMLNVVFPLITSIYVSHILLDTGVGKVAYAQNIASYFVTLAPLGVMSYGVKEIAVAGENRKKRNKTFSELFIINFVSTTFFTSIFYLLIWKTEIFVGDETLLYICGIQIFLNYINVDWLYQGLEEYGYITLRSFIVKIVSMILLFVMVRTKTDYTNYALITCIATGGNNLYNIVHMRRYVKFSCENLQLIKHIGPEIILAGNILLSNLFNKVDITMLGYLKGDSATGYYSNAFKIVNLVMCMCAAVTSAFLPRLSSYYQEDQQQYSALINKGFKYITTLTVPAAVGLSMISPVVIPFLFGETFIESARTVIIMSPLIVIKGVGDLICYQAAISSGNEKKQMTAYIIGAILNIVLNAVLIPGLVQNGAAIASVISQLCINMIVFMQIKNIVKLKINWKFISSVIFSAILMSGVIVIILRLNIEYRIVTSVLCVSAGGLVYATANFVLKNEVLIEILKKMKLYINKKRAA